MPSLGAAFVAGLGEKSHNSGNFEVWEAEVGKVVSAGSTRWPGVVVDPDAFARTLGEKVSEHAGDPAAALVRIHGVDLYLAHACAAGDPTAIHILHDNLLPEVTPALRHLGADSAMVADVTQHMLETLLVGDDGRPPRIAGYGGRGDLTSWLRSVAVRTALKLMARDRRGASPDDDLEGHLLVDDPSLVHLKHRYAAELSAALRDSLSALSVRQRMLLRLHYVDGLTVDQIGRMYRVHRATAARWVAAARETLFEETRLRVEAAGVGTELTSIVRLVQSQIHLSLSRLLDEE